MRIRITQSTATPAHSSNSPGYRTYWQPQRITFVSRDVLYWVWLGKIGRNVRGFVVDEVVLGQVFVPVVLFPPATTIPTSLHTHLRLNTTPNQKDKRPKARHLPTKQCLFYRISRIPNRKVQGYSK